MKIPTESKIPIRHLGPVMMLGLIACILAACTGVEPGTGATSTPTTTTGSPFDPTTTKAAPVATGPQLAYRANDEIGLVDGTDVVASQKGTFEPSNDLITTEDGRFVFARTTDGQLATLDVKSRRGSTRQVPVGPTLGSGGQSTIVWWEQPNRLMRLDLANPDSQPELAQTVDLPPVGGVAGEPRLIAARSGTAVLARVEAPPSPFGGPDTLYAVRGPGPPSPLGQADANTSVSVARLSPDGSALVYALYRAANNGCGTAAVVQSNADGSQSTFDVAGPDPDAGSRIARLWWPMTGQPKLSLITWQCGQPDTGPPLVWQLAGDHIAQLAPPASALQTAEVAPGQRALIVPHSNAYDEPTGTLVFDESSRRFSVKDGVDAIAVIPPPP